MTIVDVEGISQLFNKPTKEAVVLQIVVDETMPTSTEVSTLPATLLLIEELIVRVVSIMLREKVTVTERSDPNDQPMVAD